MKAAFVLIIGLYATCALAMTEVIAFQTNRIASSIIDSNGGKVQLANIGAVERA